MNRATSLTPTVERPPAGNRRAIVILLFIAAFLAAAFWTSWLRGLWLDEAWSLYEAQHDLPVADAFRVRWLDEISPFYFYLVAWLFEPLTGNHIFESRLLNLIPLIFGAIGLFTLHRRCGLGGFLAIYVVLILSNPIALQSFAEDRTYFWILAGACVLAASFWVIFNSNTDFRRSDYPVLGVAFGGMLGAFSFQSVAGFPLGVATLVLTTALWLSGKRHWASKLLAATALASLPVIVSSVLQLPALTGFSHRGWINTSTTTGISHLAELVAQTCGIVAVALLVACGRLLQSASQGENERKFLIASAIAVLVAAAALVAVNAIRPVIVPRYLLGLVPFLTAPVAAAAAPSMKGSRAFGAVMLYASVWLAISAWTVSEDRRWWATAGIIAQTAHSCPSTVVHPVPFWFLMKFPGELGPHDAPALRVGQVEAARRFGFQIERAGSTRLSVHCPTILWVEHWYDTPRPDARRVIDASGVQASREQVAGAGVVRGTTGFVVIIPAANEVAGRRKS